MKPEHNGAPGKVPVKLETNTETEPGKPILPETNTETTAETNPEGKTWQKSRSAQVNHFIDNIGQAPPHIRKRLKELDALGPKSGKRQKKGEMITEFCKHDSWDTPFFAQYTFTEEEDSSSKVKPWVSWAKFKEIEGETIAEIMWKTGKTTHRLHSSISSVDDPAYKDIDQRELYQFQAMQETSAHVSRSTKGKKMEEGGILDNTETEEAVRLFGACELDNQEGGSSAKSQFRKLPPPPKDESKEPGGVFSEIAGQGKISTHFKGLLLL